VLVLGSGGREHAMVWRLSRDPDVADVLAAPGNPGIAAGTRCLPVDLNNPPDALAIARRERVDLTVVGPEGPLERGIVDLFQAHGAPIVGPTRAAAALECSKVFAKRFMARHGIPTARFVICETAEAALETIADGTFGFPVVVKADGLAAGKGVVVAETRAEADAAIGAAMLDGRFGAAGSRLVIEECLTGPEVSFFALCDGARAVPISTAEDHKRISDGDRGPNTGGMGAFAPSPRVSDELAATVMASIVEPTLRGMQDDGAPYRGFLYVGLMLTPDGPRVIEFNVRFGDPEAQVVLPFVEGPLARALQKTAESQSIEGVRLTEGADRRVGVVLASRGYPESSEAGRGIDGLLEASAVPNVVIFHAGTRDRNGRIETAGGRVLTVVGRGATYESAAAAAYEAAGRIAFDGMQFRRDIGLKAMAGGVGVSR
jgi:phosphoribosylamine--glycine ligase